MSESQTQGPRTWFSGESSPEDRQNAQNTTWIALLLFVLFSPVGAFVAAMCYLAFTRWRIRHTVLAQLTAITITLLGLTGALVHSATRYPASVTNIINDFQADELTVGTFMQSMLIQLPVSVAVGAVFGTVICYIRWIRRSVWEKVDFRLSPLQWFKRRKNISDIIDDKNTPHNGATIGVSDFERVVQTDQEAAAHTIVVGASGSGKTTTVLMRTRDSIKNGHGVLVVDLKGGNDMAQALSEFASRYGRKFQHFAFQDPRQPYNGPAVPGPSFYDPLSRGDASMRKDMVIAGRQWSDEYYKIITSAYVQTAFDVMIGSPLPESERTDAMTDLIHLLNPAELASRARRLPDDPYYEEVREAVHRVTTQRLDRNEQSAIDGMLRELQVIRGSIAGRWMRLHDDTERNIDLYRAAERGDVVLFSLDATTYGDTAKLIANLIISDLKTVSGRLMAEPVRNPFHVFIDEFSSLDGESITGLINKSRSAGMPITLSTQALADLKRINPAFLDQLMGIVNCFLMHRTNTLVDAETLAGFIGKDKKWEVRLGVEHTSGFLGSIGKGAATGRGTLDQVEDYIISPNIIQNLKAGEVIYVAKSPRARVVQTTVYREREDLTSSGLDGAPSVRSRQGDREIFSVLRDEGEPYDAKSAERSLTPPPPLEEDGFDSANPWRDMSHGKPEYQAENEEPPVVATKPASGVLGGRDLRAAMGRASEADERSQSTSGVPARPQRVAPTLARLPGAAPTRPSGRLPHPSSKTQQPAPSTPQDTSKDLPVPPKGLPTKPLGARPLPPPAKPTNRSDTF